MSDNNNYDTSRVLGLFDYPPVDWWRFVGCGYCNASSGSRCQTWECERDRPHAQRYRAGLMLHGVLWLLCFDGGKYAGDVLGKRAAS